MTKNERWRGWYYRHHDEVLAKKRDQWAKRKAVPQCPRCQSLLLDEKKNKPGEKYVLCKECRAYINGNTKIYRARKIEYSDMVG